MKAYHEITDRAQPDNAGSRVPLMTLEAFAQASGLTVGVLRAQVYRGYWPTVKVGKKVLINLEAVRLNAISKYAELPR
ncbi:hypothetical protein [Castellaniella sp.]|uniref:hypothetical protein n=1 Tax=Castellaniella sp. TaxID=1955812 RepID=UPI002AFF3C35|nr:hypothetical protein [Castellaniella sp.]